MKSALTDSSAALAQFFAVAVMTSTLVGSATGVADEPVTPLRMQQTARGTHFAVSGEKPSQPAPTLFIIANSIESMCSDPTRFYTVTGIALTGDGWLYVVLDPPCEGYLKREDRPGGLNGWADHIRRNEDFMTPYVEGCRDVLAHLVDGGYTDPNRIAVSGTSRGGFCALQFAAAEPRIRVATCIAPVTNPLALTEFAGLTEEQILPISLHHHADRLVGRTVWMSIGNSDDRVSTDDCIRLSRALVDAWHRLRPDVSTVPVELTVGASDGHRAVPDAYEREAEFLRRQFPPKSNK